MKLDTAIQKKLIKIISTAHSIGITALIIDEHSVRGVGDKKSLILLDPDTIDMTGLGSIAINRMQLFNSRIALINPDALTVDASIRTEDNGDILVEKFIMKDKKSSVDFKCCRAAQITAPKALKSEIHYQFDISEESLRILTQANMAMKNDNLSFSLDDGVIYFKLTDNSGDMLKHEISNNVNILADDASESFFFSYDKKVLLPLIKMAFKDNSDSLSLKLTKRGIVNLTINSLNIYIAPEL